LPYVRGLLAPVLVWVVFVAALYATFQSPLEGGEEYDRAALREWIEESRFRTNLPEGVRDYLKEPTLAKRQEIQVQLQALVDPTRMYGGQLPLFPAIYRVELELPPGLDPPLAPVVWESQIPRPQHTRQVQVLEQPLLGPGEPPVLYRIEYQLHAYNKRQRDEQARAARLRWVGVLGAAGTLLAMVWIYSAQRRERETDRRRHLAQQQIASAQRRHEETERKLLEQRLATQAAERQALELKSQLYASIGIMAGSYAHNIKNLLVRPSDLLRRCLETGGLSTDQCQLLHEVRQTLGTVTERLQEILQTVRRDPTRSDYRRLDVNAVVRETARHWEKLARERWKLLLTLRLEPGPLWVEGDRSHLQQALENLLFNARDATFEMRTRLREEARDQGVAADPPDAVPAPPGRDREAVRRALIAAAGWKGDVVLRTRRCGGEAILEIRDNGIGMNEEVKGRCTQPHFSTKRDNAVHEGNSTGMGLGLSFVAAILQNHRAGLEIESEPFKGTCFRIRIPLASAAGEVIPGPPGLPSNT
jgi:signal transduction histidine kinase